LIVFAGELIFGGTCLLNTHMNPDFGGPQFQLANIVRAMGLPLSIVPLSAVATAGLLREQQADGSALFNIMRNLGGGVGTALLSTMITQREQFHDLRIGERVTAYSPYVQQFLSNQSVHYFHHSGDPVGRCSKPTECFKLRFKRTRSSWRTANASWRLASSC
jgi:MFS transporter, DHA2 family, multidrug resistance protein